jgi:frataxin
MPDTSDPKPPESEPQDHVTQPTDISYEEYHRLADLYLEELLQKVEKMQEGSEGVDVEYSVCQRHPPW